MSLLETEKARRFRKWLHRRSSARALETLDASRRRTKAYRLLIIGHVCRIRAELDRKSGQWLSLENQFFWWAFHELSRDFPRDREDARQVILEMAKSSGEWLEACDSAGVFVGNTLCAGAGDGHSITVKEPTV